MNTKQRGFTLVEISIVLVIIGLLLGGVLKGQQMIDNSRYKRLQADLDSYRSAVYMFQDRYKALPGDFDKASTELDASATDGNGNGQVGGGWCDTAGEESCLVWSHLRYAGLLGGDPTDEDQDARISDHPYGGIYDSVSTGNWANGKTELKILMRNMPGEVAQRLDNELDDGDATTGDVARYGGSGSTYDKNAQLSVFVSM